MLRSHQIALLEEKKPEGEGGAGGAPAFTEEQQKAMGQMVNAAVSSHLKRGLGTAVAEAIKGVNWGETLKLDEVLDGKLAKLLEETPETEPGKKTPENKPDPKLSALEAQIAELKAENKRSADEAKAAREQARNEKAFADLKGILGNHVRQDALDIAASQLAVVQKRIAFDEQGNPLFTVKKAPYAGAAEEEVQMTLADGVAHWIKTDEGKFFAPAPGSQQDGRRGPPGPRHGMARGPDGLPVYDKPATTDAEKIRRANEQAQALAAKYPDLA
jgi:hypothetical protein